jgi:hypothetical protein
VSLGAAVRLFACLGAVEAAMAVVLAGIREVAGHPQFLARSNPAR